MTSWFDFGEQFIGKYNEKFGEGVLKNQASGFCHWPIV
jgi:hypothetical protein